MWKIYRHKKRPEIRYWVHCEENGAPTQIRYLVGSEEAFYVSIKGVRNVRFDNEDLPFTHASEAGLWPMEKFLELYEPEEAA